MKCKKATDLICGYIDDCLSPPLRCEFEAHTQECPECRAELAATEDMLSCLGSLSCRQAPVDCWDGVRERISSPQPRSAWGSWFLRPVLAAPALAAALLLGGFLFWPANVVEPVGQSPASIPEYSHYIAAHSRLQRQQAFTDPDVTFVAAELETAGAAGGSTH